MSKRFPTEAKVGIFVILVLMALVYLSTQITSSGFSFKPTNRYLIYFDNVSGLLPRTPVEFAGIRVGRVDRIRLDGREVLVEVLLDPDMVVFEDTKISVQGRGLLGEKIIMMTGGGQGNIIPPGGAIRSADSGRGFDDAIASFSELSKTLNEMLKGGAGRASLNDVLENATVITEDLRQIVGDRKGDLGEVIHNLKVITDGMKDFVASEEGSLKEMAQSLRHTVERIDEMVARVERGEGTVGRLLKDEDTVDRVNEALDGVNEFVGAFRQLELAFGFRGEYMGSEGEPIAVTSLQIRPSFDKYFLFEVTDAPLNFGKKRRKVTTTVTNGDVEVVEETETSDRFTITALFARRFQFMTVQAGLIRSSGGLGTEFHFFRDRMRLAMQIFDLKRETNPHVRALARFNMFDGMLYVQGGVDDVFHSGGRRNFFGGAGLMLTDDDLKRLLSLLPLAAK